MGNDLAKTGADTLHLSMHILRLRCDGNIPITLFSYHRGPFSIRVSNNLCSPCAYILKGNSTVQLGHNVDRSVNIDERQPPTEGNI